jgi:hypothetical protein
MGTGYSLPNRVYLNSKIESPFAARDAQNYSANHPGESVPRLMTGHPASVNGGSADGVRRINWSRRYTRSVFGAA